MRGSRLMPSFAHYKEEPLKGLLVLSAFFDKSVGYFIGLVFFGES